MRVRPLVRVSTILPGTIAILVTAAGILAVQYLRYRERYPSIESEVGATFPIMEQREIEAMIPTAPGERVIAITKRAEGLFRVLVARVSFLHPDPGSADVYLVDTRAGTSVAKVGSYSF
jgi:hypothetical protein